jgi:ribosome-associated protein
MEPKELAKEIVKVLDKKKAEDIKVIQISELTIIADYFVIASGTSSTHIKALVEDVDFEISKLGVNPARTEGRATGWILMDYGSVIVHVFQKESREYYNLERLWSDAVTADISDIITD